MSFDEIFDLTAAASVFQFFIMLYVQLIITHIDKFLLFKEK